MPPTIGLSLLSAKVEKGHNSDQINLIFFFFFFFFNSSSDLLLSINKLTKFQCPSSNSYRDTLLTRSAFDEKTDERPKSNASPTSLSCGRDNMRLLISIS